jgi:hypothetical protein
VRLYIYRIYRADIFLGANFHAIIYYNDATCVCYGVFDACNDVYDDDDDDMIRNDDDDDDDVAT